MLDRADEARHLPDGEPDWREDYVVRWDDAASGVCGAIWVTFDGHGSATYRAVVTGTADGDVGLVAEATGVSATTTELRTDGLWADWVVAEPGRRVGLDAEAFAITIDDGASVGAGSRGDRVPFGFELDAESTGDVQASTGVGHRVGVVVAGRVLVGLAEIETSAPGWRAHTWGAGSAAGRAADLLQVGLDPLLRRFELR